MMNLFDKNKYRLSDTEKSAIWRDISLVQTERRRWWLPRVLHLPRLKLAPAFATAAVTVCGLAIIFLVSRDDTQKFRRVESVVDKSEIAIEESAAGQVVPQEPQSRDTEAPQMVVDKSESPADEIVQSQIAKGEGRQAETDAVQRHDAVREIYAPAEVAVDEMAAAPETAPGPAAEPSAVADFEKESGDHRGQDTASAVIRRSETPGITMPGGELHVRGGRSGEVSTSINDMAMSNIDVPAAKGASSNEPRSVRETPPARRGFDEEIGRDDRGDRDEWGERDERDERVEHPDPARDRCIPPWVWVPPNDQAYDTVYFQHYGVNPFVVTEEDAQSTFAIDVDNASYTVMRRYLRDGHLPPHDAVRVEEYVNFFAQDYPEVSEGDFAIAVDGAPSPFGKGYHLLRIGVQSRSVATENRRPANLVFVIDISGSMNRENRLELVKRALMILLNELEEGDRVGIVVYGSHGRVVLESTSIEQRAQIEQAIASLTPGGSTNAEEGLRLAYEMARREYQAAAINRLILCSDGVANQGRTGAESILAHVRNESDRGISLSTIGFGMGNYNDVLMEKLADQGDGGYYYVDELREAERVFRENLTGTLQTIGKDVKIQVEFDPTHVLRYRLIGYENRDVADRDFRNDAVDAGEIGAGHRVTALYEIKLSDVAAAAISHRGDGQPRVESPPRGEVPPRVESPRRSEAPHLATVRLRYQKPAFERDAGEVTEIEQKVTTGDISQSFQGAAVRLQFAAVVAEYAEILRNSYWAKGSRIADLVPMTDNIAAALSEDAAVQELRQLVRRAADLQAAAGRSDEE